MPYVTGWSRYVRFANGLSLLKPETGRVAASVSALPKAQIVEPDAHPRAVRRSSLEGDRRKVCQRILHKPVLVELRSGINRRRHNLREDDMIEHVSLLA